MGLNIYETEGWINHYTTLQYSAHIKDTNKDSRNGEIEVIKYVTIEDMNNMLKEPATQFELRTV